MLIKVNFFDKDLRIEFTAWLSLISLVFSFVLIVVEIPDKYKLAVGICLFVILFFLYFILWIRANSLSEKKLKINNSTMTVRTGDIFAESDLKVIAFNEYFDTLLDKGVIADNTLNGMYLRRNDVNISELDSLITNDARLTDKIVESNVNRRLGKSEKYQLGTIIENRGYLLAAFSKFDSDNRAYLHMNDYINFLMNFWNELDIVYGGRSVSIPLMGSGMTRFKGYDIQDQELLELLIWSFKVSRMKFTYPSEVSIIIHEPKKDKINFYKLKV